MKKREYAHSTPIMQELIARLRKRGIKVNTLVPEQHLIDLKSLTVENDLYILRPGVELALSLAGMLHDLGARILNQYEACAYVQDKARVTRKLLQYDVPTARSYIAGNVKRAVEELNGAPVIIKPHRGSYGEGIQIVDKGTPFPKEAKGGFFVQQLLKSSGQDLKVYVIGKKVFALRRKFPATSFKDKLGVATPISNEVKNIALSIGKLFNLQIYGIDFIETDDGAYVIDINYFPGFIGVDNATSHLADYIVNYALNGVSSLAIN